MSAPRCPIPSCRKRLNKAESFMCWPHQQMIPEIIVRGIVTAAAAVGSPEAKADPEFLAASKHQWRQARALAFASVCEQLGLDVDKMFQDAVRPQGPLEPELQTVRSAVLKVLNEG